MQGDSQCQLWAFTCKSTHMHLNVHVQLHTHVCPHMETLMHTSMHITHMNRQKCLLQYFYDISQNKIGANIQPQPSISDLDSICKHITLLRNKWNDF